MVLTPTIPVPKEWFFSDFTNKKVLGLASGGGQQMPIFAALGADCTVLDYSSQQINSELKIATQEGYQIMTIQADMTKPLPFPTNHFDLIFHPVSNCYVEEVQPIWQECFRILKPGGRLLAGLDNGINYLFDEPDEKHVVNRLPYNPLKNPALMAKINLKETGIQFSHTLNDQIRGQLLAGFQLKDLYEDTNGAGFLDEMNIPTFWTTFSEKPER